MMMKATIKDFISKIEEWARHHWRSIDEIVLIGSQAKQDYSSQLSNESDIDLMIFVSRSNNSTSVCSDLAALGIEFGILIHPLIITQDERPLKLSIPEYLQAYRQGKIIFRGRSGTTEQPIRLQSSW